MAVLTLRVEQLEYIADKFKLPFKVFKEDDSHTLFIKIMYIFSKQFGDRPLNAETINMCRGYRSYTFPLNIDIQYLDIKGVSEKMHKLISKLTMDLGNFGVVVNGGEGSNLNTAPADILYVEKYNGDEEIIAEFSRNRNHELAGVFIEDISDEIKLSEISCNLRRYEINIFHTQDRDMISSEDIYLAEALITEKQVSILALKPHIDAVNRRGVNTDNHRACIEFLDKTKDYDIIYVRKQDDCSEIVLNLLAFVTVRRSVEPDYPKIVPIDKYAGNFIMQGVLRLLSWNTKYYRMSALKNIHTQLRGKSKKVECAYIRNYDVNYNYSIGSEDHKPIRMNVYGLKYKCMVYASSVNDILAGNPKIDARDYSINSLSVLKSIDSLFLLGINKSYSELIEIIYNFIRGVERATGFRKRLSVFDLVLYKVTNDYRIAYIEDEDIELDCRLVLDGSELPTIKVKAYEGIYSPTILSGYEENESTLKFHEVNETATVYACNKNKTLLKVKPTEMSGMEKEAFPRFCFELGVDRINDLEVCNEITEFMGLPNLRKQNWENCFITIYDRINSRFIEGYEDIAEKNKRLLILTKYI